MTVTINGTTGVAGVDGTAATPAIQGNDTNTGIFFPAADTIAFAEGGAEVARFDSSGNLGIGTSSPSARFDVRRSTTDGLIAEFHQSSGYGLDIASSDSIASISSGYLQAFTFKTDSGSGQTERMRIDSSGRVQIGTTATNPAPSDTYGIVLGVDGAGSAYAGASQFSTNGTAGIILNRGGDNGTTLAFKRSGTTVGGVNVTTTATSYGTSSDYRLKENIAPMTGALAKVQQLKPVTYTWKADNSDGQGFIAHELAEVVPDAVTGAKDAVDAEGNPEYQGIDTSFLVATLTAAIQEQQAIITDLKSRIEALEQA
jgi:hypothetical protein